MATEPVTNLVVGDPHVTITDLPECERLMDFVRDTAMSRRARVVTLMGDLHNNHDTVSIRVDDFWRRHLRLLVANSVQVVIIKGNHDQAYPDRQEPHILSAYADIPHVLVVDHPMHVVSLPGVVALPYYHDAAAFKADAAALRTKFPNHKTLFCHQTFDGSQYENGFYAPDGIPAEDLGFEEIWSGHIHHPQSFGPVRYPGAPRWRTRSDANVDRFLVLLAHTPDSIDVLDGIPTSGVCRKIWAFDDTPGTPVDLSGISPGDDVRIDVYGPDSAAVRAREAVLQAMGAKTRPFPDAAVRAHGVTEAVGVQTSLKRYAAVWKAPGGSDPAAVLKEVESRVAAI